MNANKELVTMRPWSSMTSEEKAELLRRVWVLIKALEERGINPSEEMVRALSVGEGTIILGGGTAEWFDAKYPPEVRP